MLKRTISSRTTASSADVVTYSGNGPCSANHADAKIAGLKLSTNPTETPSISGTIRTPIPMLRRYSVNACSRFEEDKHGLPKGQARSISSACSRFPANSQVAPLVDAITTGSLSLHRLPTWPTGSDRSCDDLHWRECVSAILTISPSCLMPTWRQHWSVRFDPASKPLRKFLGAGHGAPGGERSALGGAREPVDPGPIADEILRTSVSNAPYTGWTKRPAKNAPAMGPNPGPATFDAFAGSLTAVDPSINTRISNTSANAAPRKIRASKPCIRFSSKLIAVSLSDILFASAVHAPSAPQATGTSRGTQEANRDSHKLSAPLAPPA